MTGKWVDKMPNRVGKFPVADKSNTNGSFHYVVVYQETGTQKFCAASRWSGWWWSEPLPNLPVPPVTRASEKPWF